MAPFAVKPPFATDEPDSVFVDQDKRTPRPRKQRLDATAPGGDRDSAYTAYVLKPNPIDSLPSNFLPALTHISRETALITANRVWGTLDAAS